MQGVGFRPAMLRLAKQCDLAGFIFNGSGSVTMEVQGTSDSLERFFKDLSGSYPPAARVNHLDMIDLTIKPGENEFVIRESEGNGMVEGVPPDLAICPECLQEMLDPGNRRYLYPLISCTNCGPRFTIIEGLPYDRPFTSMKLFPLCHDCHGEYTDLMNRRFHAQPVSCHRCGPRVLFRRSGEGIPDKGGADPIREAADLILRGGILAIKGNGGYHLACDATDEPAIGRLRERKRREKRAFAIMCLDTDQARGYVAMDRDEMLHFESPAAPVVLLKRKEGCSLPESLAPGNDRLGIMKAYTGLHVLLLRMVGRPLVMTSANYSDEPIAYLDHEALERLSPIVDGFLYHDREIRTRMDDSVLHVSRGEPVFIRRSRGYAPRGLEMPFRFKRSIFATGGELKNVFALARGREIVPGHHVGDLKHPAAFRSYKEGLDHFFKLYEFSPDAIVCDLHPSYENTKWAVNEAENRQIPLISVQHHHAHIVSCMAENRYTDVVLGVAMDGLGFGEGGDLRGAEVMLCDTRDYLRIAHLDPIYLPGGDLCTKEVWRVGFSLLFDGGRRDLLEQFVSSSNIDPFLIKGVESLLLNRDRGGIFASSGGRLFDGVRFLLGGDPVVSFESQGALELESLAASASAKHTGDELRFSFDPDTGKIDWKVAIRTMLERIAAGDEKSVIAREFHIGLYRSLARVVVDASRKYGVRTVALSGGVFLNRILLQGMVDELSGAGLNVLTHSILPPGDGGIAAGQAVIAESILEGQDSCVWQYQ